LIQQWRSRIFRTHLRGYEQIWTQGEVRLEDLLKEIQETQAFKGMTAIVHPSQPNPDLVAKTSLIQEIRTLDMTDQKLQANPDLTLLKKD
jgi:hypothetical protein